MDSQHVFCPNLACHARGHRGKGNIRVHSHQEHRYRCTECGKTFVARTGTIFYGRHTDEATMTQILTLVAHGCPIPAIEVAFGLQRRTIQTWVDAAGRHCEQVHQHLVVQPRDLGQVQADELRVKTQTGIVWLAMALMVSTRLWLGSVSSPARDRTLIHMLLLLVQRCASVAPLLLVMDGLPSYVTQARKVFRTSLRTGQRGAPRKQLWPQLCLGQVIKQVQRKRVVAVLRQVVHGPPALLDQLVMATQGHGGLNTAYIERLNATFRARLATLVRRTRGAARKHDRLHLGSYLVGTIYNFCTLHTSLTLTNGTCRTPAMAAGLTDYCWTITELLTYRVAPPRWQPAKRRGRRSQADLALLAKWAC